ncbi:alanyl-tRNA editing protein [Clostridium guangxiense]|uniref:alanyl-tRNA editing protein n=1 Tax=Clostridium guangxiense TaxID=1662055 RepID=UPI001E589E06|nr:DHHA1 domain-containing protein [Clostridium guangxiense]MCD2347318.1 DHHA1 domain-containing protein [Clostridium guangxiense]
MTEKMFYDDPYVCEGEGRILDIIEKNNKYEVVLDKTPFYPEGGGQPCDLGTINGMPVEYVREKDDVIYHVMNTKPDGEIAKCKVDFLRRRDNIQQHTGEHLLSAAFFKLYKGVNCGFHMGEDYITIDIDMEEVNESMVQKVEEEVNNYIYMNVPTKTYFMSKDEAKKLPLRKAIKAEGRIRIVQLGDVDYSACCGTHVVRTGEVGIVKVLKTEKYKGMTRVYFKCGERALKHVMKEHDIISKLQKLFSTEEDKLVDRVNSQNEEIMNLRKEVSEYKKNEAKIESEKLLKSSHSKLISAHYEDRDFDFIESIYDCLKDEEAVVILTSGKDNRIIFAQNAIDSVQCGKIFKENIKGFNGRGGGSPKRAQAAFSNKEDLSRFVEFLKEKAI